MKAIKWVTYLLLTVCLCACTSWWSSGEVEDNGPYKGLSAKTLYTNAKSDLKKEEYTGAIKKLEAMESMYPFNPYAEQATMDLIYAYYKKEDYPSAAAVSERFIHMYPRARHVDYAYYMRGLANFQQPRGPFAKYLPYDEAWRDPGTQSEAYSNFATLVQKFPRSQYRANSLQRMIYLRNIFAEHDLRKAQYYFDRNKYVASLERAGQVVRTYQQAPAVQPAMEILYISNKKLGLNDAAANVAKVYADTYKKTIPGYVG